MTMLDASAVTRWRWHADQFEEADRLGWFGDQRVELWNGDVIPVPPMNLPHAHGVGSATDAIVPSIDRTRFATGVQIPVLLGDLDLPEPDIWVARGSRVTFATRRPTADDLVLAIEISDSTLAHDRDVKVPRYAAAGVTEVWIVDVNARKVHIYSQPDRVAAAYGSMRTLHEGDIATVPEAGVAVTVSDLFVPRDD